MEIQQKNTKKGENTAYEILINDYWYIKPVVMCYVTDKM